MIMTQTGDRCVCEEKPLIMNISVSLNWKYWFCSIFFIMWNILTNLTWHYCAYIHTDIWHTCMCHCLESAESNSSASQHSLVNIVNERVCVLWVYCWLCDESSVAHTCAELRAFHLFPSLAPDLPPTMGSWPRRLTPARTPALPDTVAADIYECIDTRFARRHMHIVFCVTFDPLLPVTATPWPSSNTLVSCKLTINKKG